MQRRMTDNERSRDDLILNQSTAVSRSIYNQPWYESLVTRRPTVRFNENILIDRDTTRLPPDSLKMWLKRSAIVEIEFRSSYKHDPSSLLQTHKILMEDVLNAKKCIFDFNDVSIHRLFLNL